MQIQNKNEIIAALDKNITSFNNFIAPLNKEQFEATPGGKWSAGQNLEHLIRTTRPFFPPVVLFEKKDGLIEKYVRQKQNLISKIKKQKEGDLSLYILLHPLLGKITLREMLFFTIHHNEHHLELLRGRG